MHLHWVHHVVGVMKEIQDSGTLGCLIFVLLYAACCLLFVPGSILTIGAGAVYGFWEGMALVLIGNGLGSVASLLVTRYLLRDWISGWVKKSPKLQALEKAIAEDDLKLVFLTRLSPVMPFSLINYSLGLTKIKAWRFLFATELGAVPATCVYVYFGSMMGNLARIGPEIHEHQPILWTVQGVGIALALGVTIYVSLVARKKIDAATGGRQHA